MAPGAYPAGTVVTVFRSRLTSDAGTDFTDLSAEMVELARRMPGFLEYKAFTADDGERCSLIVFESPETQAAWRDHPDHRTAQERGRARFYSEYRILVSDLREERSFEREPGGS